MAGNQQKIIDENYFHLIVCLGFSRVNNVTMLSSAIPPAILNSYLHHDSLQIYVKEKLFFDFARGEVNCFSQTEHDGTEIRDLVR